MTLLYFRAAWQMILVCLYNCVSRIYSCIFLDLFLCVSNMESCIDISVLYKALRNTADLTIQTTMTSIHKYGIKLAFINKRSKCRYPYWWYTGSFGNEGWLNLLFEYFCIIFSDVYRAMIRAHLHPNVQWSSGQEWKICFFPSLSVGKVEIRFQDNKGALI